MKRGFTVGLVTVLLIGLVLGVPQEAGLSAGKVAPTHVKVTCKPTGKPLVPCVGAKVELYYGDGTYIGQQEGKYKFPLFGGTLSFYFGKLDQEKGFIVKTSIDRGYPLGYTPPKTCSFPPKKNVWGERILRVTMTSEGVLKECKG